LTLIVIYWLWNRKAGYKWSTLKTNYMAQFTIQLPDNSKWEVRSGRVSKKRLWFFHRKKAADVRIGYIVFNKSSSRQYRFLRTSDGNWMSESEAGFEAGKDEISIFIKRQIDKYEKRSPFI